MSTCCTSMANIEKVCGGGNSSGIRTKVRVACVDQVLTIPPPDADSHIISVDIAMVLDIGDGSPGKFYEIAISKSNQGYTAENQGDDENPDYLHTLTFNILKMTPAKQYALNGMGGGEFIVTFLDRNDLQWLIGDLNEGATIAIVPQTNDINGYAITISWRSPKLLYNYTGALSIAV